MPRPYVARHRVPLQALGVAPVADAPLRSRERSARCASRRVGHAARSAARRPPRRPRAHRGFRSLGRPRMNDRFERDRRAGSRAALARTQRARRAIRSARRDVPRRRLSDRLGDPRTARSSPMPTATATSISPARSASPRIGHTHDASPRRSPRKRSGSCTAWATCTRPTSKRGCSSGSPRSRPAIARKRTSVRTAPTPIEFALKTALLATGRARVALVRGRLSRPLARRAAGRRHRALSRTVRAAGRRTRDVSAVSRRRDDRSRSALRRARARSPPIRASAPSCSNRSRAAAA